MAREIQVCQKYTKSYSTKQRAINAADKIVGDAPLLYLIYTMDDGTFTPIFTNAVQQGWAILAHKGYMITG